MWAFSDATVAELPLDAAGAVPWWSAAHRDVTLHRVLVHVLADLTRHAGHADILRETIDGAVGRRPHDTNIEDGYDWAAHHARVDATARHFS